MKNIDIDTVGTSPLTVITCVLGGVWICLAVSYLREVNFYRKHKWDFSKDYESTMRWGNFTTVLSPKNRMSPKVRLVVGYPIPLSFVGTMFFSFFCDLLKRIAE